MDQSIHIVNCRLCFREKEMKENRRRERITRRSEIEREERGWAKKDGRKSRRSERKRERINKKRKRERESK